MKNISEVLESYMIPKTIACEKFSLSTLIKKFHWKSPKLDISKYKSMSDQELANLLIDSTKKNFELYNDSNEKTKETMNSVIESANRKGKKYKIYRRGNGMVLVVEDKNPDKNEFNIWSYLPISNEDIWLSTTRKLLIRDMAKEYNNK